MSQKCFGIPRDEWHLIRITALGLGHKECSTGIFKEISSITPQDPKMSKRGNSKCPPGS